MVLGRSRTLVMLQASLQRVIKEITAADGMPVGCRAMPGHPGLRLVRERPTANSMCVAVGPNSTKLGALELSPVPNRDPSGSLGILAVVLGGWVHGTTGAKCKTACWHNFCGNAKPLALR